MSISSIDMKITIDVAPQQHAGDADREEHGAQPHEVAIGTIVRRPPPTRPAHLRPLQSAQRRPARTACAGPARSRRRSPPARAPRSSRRRSGSRRRASARAPRSIRSRRARPPERRPRWAHIRSRHEQFRHQRAQPASPRDRFKREIAGRTLRDSACRLSSQITNRNSTMIAPAYTMICRKPTVTASRPMNSTAIVNSVTTSASRQCTGLRCTTTPSAEIIASAARKMKVQASSNAHPVSAPPTPAPPRTR